MGIRESNNLSTTSADLSRRDFSRYDEQKDPIEAVGLVKAKRGKFNLKRRLANLTQ